MSFAPEDTAFIVSDIKTKLFLESQLLQKRSCLPGACVMRPNDFYKELFYFLDRRWHLIPDNYAQGLLFDFCNQSKGNKFKNLQNSKSFFEFFNSFLVVFLHQENFKAFEEWLDNCKNIFLKNWFQLSKSFFEFLSSKKVLHESGVKSLLLYNLSLIDELSFYKDRILVDLSFTIDLCEKEIFKELSRYKEVYILSPHLEHSSFFEDKMDIYKQWEKEQSQAGLLEYPNNIDLKTQEPSSFKNLFKIKAETQIEEVRKATAQICKWIKQGVSPNDIVVFAPHLENYWFALRSYFEKESIPFKKAIYSKLIDFKDVKYLLAGMRVHLNLFDFEDLEIFYFYKETKKDFMGFKRNYFDEPHRDLIKKLLVQNQIKDFNQQTKGVDFVQWLLSFWPKTSDGDLLESLLSILQKFSVEETLTYKSWLRFFESELFSKELEIESEQSEGVSCLSFNAFHSVKSPYVFILGLTESALKESSLFLSNESNNILEDLGLPIAIASSKQKENSLLWFLQSSHYKELYLSYHSYNFKGDIQTVSLLYMLSDKLFCAQKTDILESLSWDYKIKQATLSKILSDKPEEQMKMLSRAFQNQIQPIFSYKKRHLSANGIKTYRACPFKYAGKNLFFAPEEQTVQREVSAIYKGNLAHKLFEKTLKEYPDLEMTEMQIKQLIESLRVEPEQLIHKKQWLLMTDYLKRVLKEFLIKEKEQRKKFPQLKPVAFEAKLKAFWNQEKGELSHHGEYPFKGFLDRVDQDDKTKQYVLRDYKASSHSLSHISSWLETEELQLTFYAQALEKGLVESLSPKQLSALFYSVYNEQFIAKGFEEKDSALAGIMGVETTKRQSKEKDFLYQVIDVSNRFTKKKVEQMEQGYFSPDPADTKNCKKCFYKTWCRVEEK